MRCLVLISILASCGDNVLPAGELLRLSNGSPCFGIASAIGDFDGDDRAELAVADADCSYNDSLEDWDYTRLDIHLFEMGATEPTQTVSVQPPSEVFGFLRTLFATRMQVGDFDNDGVDDIFLELTHDSYFIGLGIRERGLGRFEALQLDERYGEPQVISQSDRRAALLMSYGSAGGTKFDQWRGAGFETVFEIPEFGSGFIDVNGDGARDLVFREEGRTLFYKGCADECAFLLPEPELFHPEEVRVWPDLNGDGRAEIQPIGPWGGIDIRFSSEDGYRGGRWSRHFGPPGGGVSAIANVVGDSKPDLFVRGPSALYLFEASANGLAEQAYGSWPVTTPGGMWLRNAGVVRFPDVALFRAVVSARGSGTPGFVELTSLQPYSESDAPELSSEPRCEVTGEGLPDLTVDTDFLAQTISIESQFFEAEACEVEHQCVTGSGDRDLLLFSVSVVNLGNGAATLPGPALAPDDYEFDDCHGHHHVRGFSRYELVDPAGEEVVVGRKQGYRFVDSYAYCTGVEALPIPTDPLDASVISAGWSDIYPAGLSCQWLDVTGVPAGDYQLRITVNANGLIEEDDQHPNQVSVPVTIP